MRKAISVAAVLLAVVAPHIGAVESTWEFSVQVSADVQVAPPRITLSWPQDTYLAPAAYTVYRKAPAATSWGSGTTLAGTATNYTDTAVNVGTGYEYQVVKRTSQYTGYGYVYAGINLPLTEVRGRLLLVVDNTYAADLAHELARLQRDLVGDGWTVTRLDVSRTDSVAQVKNLIKARYDADRENVKAVFLFGHVPVPYSGNIVPDGHQPEHQGAWPCDGFYGDMDGVWTDSSVNSGVATDARTRNLPGDGKYDQSTFPAAIKLMVGRVDLANMPGRLSWGGAPTFPSELELLRNYLNKDHNFRNKQFDLPRRAFVGDYFGVRNGEAFAASGWRNLSSFFGSSNLSNVPTAGTWIATLSTNACLWAYGCGSGSYTSIGGLGSTGVYRDGITTELFANDVKTVFAFLFGSWLGDWDSEDNIQRAVLALPSYGLTCAWSGRPHWFLQHMALGEPIGFGARLTQNNSPGGLYQNQVNSCAGQTHIALMGDPTLRLHTVAPPTQVQATTNGTIASLSWNPSTDLVAGYHVYRASNPNGPFTRLTPVLLTTTSYVDANAGLDATYMIRAVKLETSASGTYFNSSQGAFLSTVGAGNVTGTEMGPKATNAALVTISTPTPNATVAGSTVSVSANASHPAGIASVQFTLDGTNLGAPLTTSPYQLTWDTRSVADGAHTLTAVGRDNSGNKAASSPLTFTVANSQASMEPLNSASSNVVWIDDALPTGAVPAADGGDSWAWVGANPKAFSGTVAHQATAGTGLHQHYFSFASSTLTVNTGEVLYTYVYLDPNNPPTEVMVQWNDGSWEHRAFWGANQIVYGSNDSAGRRYMGPLPAVGQWVRLEVPASQVGLEGTTVSGMAFSLYGGRATWDYTGKASVSASNPVISPTIPPFVSTNTASTVAAYPSTSSLPGSSVADYTMLELPKVGSNTLHVLTPNMLELKLINTKQPDPAPVTQWDLVNSGYQFVAPPLGAFAVTANGQPVAISAVGFKRRPLYAQLATFDLRIESSLYLQLASPVSDNQAIEVRNPDGTLWTSSMKFACQVNPLRYSPAIHVNQEGYLPSFSKKAMIGYYAGSLGEVTIPGASGFKLVDAGTGAQVYQGSLVQRADVGYTYNPTPYQKVYEADFTSFTTPGEYRLVIPGMGGSLPFRINDGIAMSFARAYALGLYHQRCGTSNAHPHTRFTHDACHLAPATVPSSDAEFPFTWKTISHYSQLVNSENPLQTAPVLSGPDAQRFPFVRQGTVDTSGGHHDAGDYSKYTANSASFIHYLMVAVDSLSGVGALDNLGLPESGDGISDLLQEAKWEADFLAKIQDSDGGFYFLVYPRDREYESGALPEQGDPQVVWPKTTAVTAAAVAALAQCASSPRFKQAYPAAAALYLQKARLGWEFLTSAIATHGKGGGYQKITHYADDFTDKDELAWAACEMYLATGDSAIHELLLSWFDPADAATRRWGWWRMSQAYGHAIRSYAFAVRSGRLASTSQLNGTFLGKCQTEINAAAEDVLRWSQRNAYGTSFSEEAKRVKAAGWYFSTDQAFDMVVAYQLNPKADYLTALLANMNYEGGCNPVNVSFITGLGWKRQRDLVSQYAPYDRRVLPPSGIPIGNVQSTFPYTYTYQGELARLTFPHDDAPTAPYPFYDRWGDSWNVTAEFVILNSARSLASLGFLAALTSLKTQPWKSATGQLSVPSSVVTVGTPVTVTLQVPGMDVSSARIVWEAREQEPAFGPSFTFTPKDNGSHWVEAEAVWPDGRRVFATASFKANSPNVVWLDDALPTGATAAADGGDSWNWTGHNPASGALSHQSSDSAGVHQHYFDNATATLAVEAGDVLYAYVFLDPANPPTSIMLQWNDGSWNHRAYWGANNFTYGQYDTASRRYMGALPPAGQWVQLKVPASLVDLEGRTVKGMAFTLYQGRATWDAAGRLSPSEVATSSVPATLTVNSQGPLLLWNSVSARSYRVTYKNDLKDPAWTVAADVTATGSLTSWLDSTAAQRGQRFYSVRQLSPIDTAETPANFIRVKSFSVNAQGAALLWNSVPAASYRVWYKNSLADATWTIGANVTATGDLTSWTDTTAKQASQRFYSITQL
jgi:hypothetical protein